MPYGNSPGYAARVERTTHVDLPDFASFDLLAKIQGATTRLVPSYPPKWPSFSPPLTVNGHFEISPDIPKGSERLRARIDVTLVDIYQRKHLLLPIGYIHGLKPQDQWYAEPSMELLGIADL